MTSVFVLQPPAGATAKGPRARFHVLGVLVSLAAITYLDRVCIAITAPSITHALGLSQLQMAFVFSSFSLAYALFEVPTGAWVDRIGAKKVLTRIVIWWSIFTGATGAAFSYPVLLVTRFLFGVGEAGAWPAVSSAITRWFPKTERGTAQGIFFMGAHLAGGLTPILIIAMLRFINWRLCFAVFAVIGMIWAICWKAWFRDHPPDGFTAHGANKLVANLPEGSHGHAPGTPWKAVFTSRSVYGLCGMYFTQSYGFYFYITWLPTYLHEARGLSSNWLALYSGMPLLFSVAADLFGGIATDRVTHRYGLRAGRVGVGCASFVLAGICMFAGIACRDKVPAVLLISCAAAFSAFTLGAAWAATGDVGGPHAGVVSACMNTAGQTGGALCPVVLAMCLRHFASWNVGLYAIASLYLAGALCWTFVNPERVIAPELEQIPSGEIH